MKNLFSTTFMVFTFAISLTAFAQLNIALDDACNSDPDLIDSIVEIIQTGSTNGDHITSEEANQVNTFLAEDANQGETVSEKLQATLEACSDGRIFQSRHSNIIDAQ